VGEGGREVAGLEEVDGRARDAWRLGGERRLGEAVVQGACLGGRCRSEDGAADRVVIGRKGVVCGAGADEALVLEARHRELEIDGAGSRDRGELGASQGRVREGAEREDELVEGARGAELSLDEVVGADGVGRCVGVGAGPELDEVG
jgi:hypothetical protein